MADDFLNDISSSVDNAGSPAPEQSIVQEITNDIASDTPTETPTKAPTEPSLSDSLNAMFDANDPYKEEVAPKKEEVAPKPKEEKQETTPVEPKKEQVKEPLGHQRKTSSLLDTFLNEDKAGNLTDDAGNIIATAGLSRTNYERLKNEGRSQRKAATDLAIANASLADKFKGLYNEYQEMSKGQTDPIQNIVKETGFSTDEARGALDIIKQYKTDPIAAIKNMLTQAKMRGINISEIGANISADPAQMTQAMEQMLEKRLGPITTQSEESNRRRVAEQQSSDFIQKYPDSVPYIEYVAQAKTQFPEMSLDEIWLRIRGQLENSEQKRPQQQNNTMHSRYTNPTNSPTQIPKPRVAKVPPVTKDVAYMSFAEIAQMIQKESQQ